MEKVISKFIEENRVNLLKKGWLNDFEHLIELESIMKDLKGADTELISAIVKFLGFEKITSKYKRYYRFIFDYEDDVLYVITQ